MVAYVVVGLTDMIEVDNVRVVYLKQQPNLISNISNSVRFGQIILRVRLQGVVLPRLLILDQMHPRVSPLPEPILHLIPTQIRDEIVIRRQNPRPPGLIASVLLLFLRLHRVGDPLVVVRSTLFPALPGPLLLERSYVASRVRNPLL